jgi:hypothetical protein
VEKLLAQLIQSKRDQNCMKNEKTKYLLNEISRSFNCNQRKKEIDRLKLITHETDEISAQNIAHRRLN